MTGMNGTGGTMNGTQANGVMNGISAYLTPERLDAIARPVGEGRGLPNACFTSEDYLRFERDHLMAKTWTCIGTGKDIPEPGDARPYSLLGIPLLLLRDQEGGIKVFHNVCSHRGLELVSKPCNVGKVVRCPYHSWAYDLAGKLRATPLIDKTDTNGCPSLDRDKLALKPVRTAVWFDLVFVDLSGEAPDFADHVGPLSDRWQHLAHQEIYAAGRDSEWELTLQGNWKLIIENHDDAYHLPWVHPSLNSYSSIKDHYEILGGDLYAGQGSNRYVPRWSDNGASLPKFADLPEDWQTRSEYIVLYPNTIVGVHYDHLWTVWLEPLAADRTIERMTIYYADPAVRGDDYADLRRAVHKEWQKIWAEDQDVVEGMQRGRGSPAFDGGVFTPQFDDPTHHMHRWVAGRLSRELRGADVTA